LIKLLKHQKVFEKFENLFHRSMLLVPTIYPNFFFKSLILQLATTIFVSVWNILRATFRCLKQKYMTFHCCLQSKDYSCPSWCKCSYEFPIIKGCNDNSKLYSQDWRKMNELFAISTNHMTKFIGIYKIFFYLSPFQSFQP